MKWMPNFDATECVHSCKPEDFEEHELYEMRSFEGVVKFAVRDGVTYIFEILPSPPKQKDNE